MYKVLSVAGVAVIAVTLFSFRPASSDAAAGVNYSSALFVSLTKDAAGKVTAVTVNGPDCGVSSSSEPVANCTYTVVKTSIFRDANNRPLKTAYMQPGDLVSLRVTKASGGSLTKMVDKNVIGTTVSGKTSNVNNVDANLTLTISRRIKELAQNATFSTTVQSTSSTSIKQIEVAKVGNRTTRTAQTKTWTDVNDGQNVTVTGFWNSRLLKIDATKVQLANKTL